MITLFYFVFSLLISLSFSSFSNMDVGLDGVDGYIAAFGDLNSDKFVDLFIVSTDNSRLTVYKWSSKKLTYILTEATIYEPGGIIENVIPGDFDVDGKLDVLLIGKKADNLPFFRIYKGKHTIFDPTPYDFTSIVPETHFLAMNMNPDLRIDLFSTRMGIRQFWINTLKDNSLTFELEQQVLPPEALPQLTMPHSSATVDLNGDCMADLFVTTTGNGKPSQFELFLANSDDEKENFVFHQAWPIRPGTGQVSFADVNGDGHTDIIYPICYPPTSCEQEQSIHIIINQQIGLCHKTWWGQYIRGNCRIPDDLCTPDDNFILTGFNSTQPNEHHIIITPDMFPPNTRLLTPSDLSLLIPPLTLRLGDADLDGFPDILVPLYSYESQKSFIAFLKNVPCLSNCHGASRRYVHSRMSKLNSIPNAYSAVWADINNRGIPDIYVHSINAYNQIMIKVLSNDFAADAFFIKSIGLGSDCPEWCPTSPQFPHPKPYGQSQPGVVTKFTVTDLNGRLRMHTGTQLSQSAFNALQLPYLLFGVGRSDNYIENLFFGAGHQINQWMCLIPNSQLLIFPYPPLEPLKWNMELLIAPSSSLLFVVGLLFAVLMILGWVALYYHWVEIKDEIQKREFIFRWDRSSN